MSLFGPSNNNVIGVDIGTSSLKLVELSHKDGHCSLSTYGFIEKLEHDAKMSAKDETTFLANQIKSIISKTKFTTNTAIASLPTYAVFTSLISLPHMTNDELAQAVHWEAKNIIPLPLEDIVLDYKVLNAPGKKSMFKSAKTDVKAPEFLKVLITGAARETVKRYSDIFAESGLNLISLETETFALTRALVGDDPAEALIVEIGNTTTDVIFVQNSVPFLSRSIEVGGQALTRAVINSLNINERRAEQLKRDIGIVMADSSGAGVPKIIENALEPLVHEIKYSLDLYKNMTVTPGDTFSGVVEKVILTGGTALMPNFAKYLGDQLNVRVVAADPWSRIIYPEDLRPVLAGIGPKFSVSIGLALRDPAEDI